MQIKIASESTATHLGSRKLVLGSIVYGLGPRPRRTWAVGVGFRVQGLGSMVQGLRSRVEG